MIELRNEPYRVTLEVVNRHCQGLQALKDHGIDQCVLQDARRVSGGVTRHLIRVPAQQSPRLPPDLSIRTQNARFVTVWIESDGCDVCNTILDNSSFLVSGRHVRDYTIIYTFVAPTFDAYQTVVTTLEARGFQPRVLELGKVRLNSPLLTDKQKTVLWLAYQRGFFECPRKINTIQLARELGIATSTLSELVRRGLHRLLEHHFHTDES